MIERLALHRPSLNHAVAQFFLCVSLSSASVPSAISFTRYRRFPHWPRLFPRLKSIGLSRRDWRCCSEETRHIRRVIKLDTLGWRKSAAPLATIEKMARSVVALREFAYETAIDFQGLYKSAIIARISRSRERLGFAENWLREPAAGVFYTERVAPRGRHHIIEMNFSLVERLGVRVPEADQWEFPLPRTPEDDRYVEKSLASLGAQDFVVVNPGGGWQAKRWAPERYAELIQRLESGVGWDDSTDRFAG